MPEPSPLRRPRPVAPAPFCSWMRWYSLLGAIVLFGMGVLAGRLSMGPGASPLSDGRAPAGSLEEERLVRLSAEERAERAEATLMKLEQQERDRLETERLNLAERQDQFVATGDDKASSATSGMMLDPTVVGRPTGDMMKALGVDDGVGEASPGSQASPPLGSGDAREWRSKYRYAALKYNRLVSNYDRLQKKYMEMTGADGGKNGIVTGSMFYKLLRRSTREELDRVRKELNGGVSTRRVREVQFHIEALEERESWLKRKAHEMGIE